MRKYEPFNLAAISRGIAMNRMNAMVGGFNLKTMVVIDMQRDGNVSLSLMIKFSWSTSASCLNACIPVYASFSLSSHIPCYTMFRRSVSDEASGSNHYFASILFVLCKAAHILPSWHSSSFHYIVLFICPRSTFQNQPKLFIVLLGRILSPPFCLCWTPPVI